MIKKETYKKVCEALDYAVNWKAMTGQPMEDIIIEVVTDYKKALTPPTAEEVCKALSEYFNSNIIYEWGTMTFKFDIDWIEISKLTIEKRVDVTMLPPHIITLIGRFYEGLQ